MNRIDYNRSVVIKTEIKRINEKLTKRELCDMYGINYQFYINVVSYRNDASKKMLIILNEYLKTSTDEIYVKVFASREAEKEFHHNLGINLEIFEQTQKEIEFTNSVRISEEDIESLRESAKESGMKNKK